MMNTEDNKDSIKPALRVGQLRAMLEGVDDDTPVAVEDSYGTGVYLEADPQWVVPVFMLTLKDHGRGADRSLIEYVTPEPDMNEF